MTPSDYNRAEQSWADRALNDHLEDDRCLHETLKRVKEEGTLPYYRCADCAFEVEVETETNF